MTTPEDTARRLMQAGITASLPAGPLELLEAQHLRPLETARLTGTLGADDPLTEYARAVRLVLEVNAWHQCLSIDRWEHWMTGQQEQAPEEP